MGRITNLQNQVTELQGKLAKQNKAIAQINVRDTKIKKAISDFAADPDTNKSAIPVLTAIAGIL